MWHRIDIPLSIATTKGYRVRIQLWASEKVARDLKRQKRKGKIQKVTSPGEFHTGYSSLHSHTVTNEYVTVKSNIIPSMFCHCPYRNKEERYICVIY